VVCFYLLSLSQARLYLQKTNKKLEIRLLIKNPFMCEVNLSLPFLQVAISGLSSFNLDWLTLNYFIIRCCINSLVPDKVRILGSFKHETCLSHERQPEVISKPKVASHVTYLRWQTSNLRFCRPSREKISRLYEHYTYSLIEKDHLGDWSPGKDFSFNTTLRAR